MGNADFQLGKTKVFLKVHCTTYMYVYNHIPCLSMYVSVTERG